MKEVTKVQFNSPQTSVPASQIEEIINDLVEAVQELQEIVRIHIDQPIDIQGETEREKAYYREFGVKEAVLSTIHEVQHAWDEMYNAEIIHDKLNHREGAMLHTLEKISQRFDHLTP